MTRPSFQNLEQELERSNLILRGNMALPFHSETCNFDHMADQLYNAQTGAFIVPDLLKTKAQKFLREEIQSNKHLLQPARPVYGKAEQRFTMHYWGSYETGTYEDKIFPLITQFAQTYDLWVQPLIMKAKLSQQHVSSIGVHIYPENKEQGLGPHRDHSNVQLVSCFVLEGYAPFYTGKDHRLTDKVSFEPQAGSLLLMRGPRNEEERQYANNKSPTYDSFLDPRPIHCVGPVEQERTVIILRHISEEAHA